MLEEYEKKEPIIYRQISNSIKNGLSHAYLFELNDNIYAYEMIMSFVKKVLSNGDDNIAKRIDDGNYPELKHIFPDGQLIRKEQLEELQKSFSTISLENDKRFYIIHDSEKLNVAAANSLLKFLEEPSDGIIAILLTNNINLSKINKMFLQNNMHGDMVYIERWLGGKYEKGNRYHNYKISAWFYVFCRNDSNSYITMDGEVDWANFLLWDICGAV